ncbi:PepSY domain-containing protein [Metabacillus malikii]|uniref:Small secreted protein n=1 Tax=Metabacillus malikii TaxID=1504265 RepID=A0ABT9ZMS4_9BACI|nr:PepSY domain-containing protein [Metabacillus malikii]MDQ0233592.1 putative small secreted protein [Metabacillus malikii]
MKGKYFYIGFGLGVATGYLLKDKVMQRAISSEKALNIVKQAFKEKGPIDGSWIYTIPEAYSTEYVTYDVYKAGISRTVDGESEQYEAFVDKNTGLIVHVEQIN